MFSAALFIIASTWKQPKCPLTEEWVKKMWCGTYTQWNIQFSSVVQSCQTLCNPMDCSTPGSLSITNSQTLLKPRSIKSVMPSNHLILCCPLLLPSVFPSIRVFSNESVLHITWKNIGASALASVLTLNIQDWFPLGLISLQSEGLWRVFSNTTVQKHQFFNPQVSFYSNSHIHTWLLEKT